MVEKKAELSEGAAEQGESLGKSLAHAREGRKLSREEASGRTRIPIQYLKMMESGDYGLISDQLYLLPYVRKYAAFLGLDAEDNAMRFIREVQHADNSAARLAEPLAMGRKRRGAWVGFVAVVLLVAVAGGFYLLKSHRHLMQRAAAPSPVPQAAAKAQAVHTAAAAAQTSRPHNEPSTATTR